MRTGTASRSLPVLLAALAAAALAAGCQSTPPAGPPEDERDDQVAALLDRIDALEEQLHALQRAPDVVRARRFELVGPSGEPRAVLAVEAEGHAGLLLRDVEGRDAIWLGVRGELWGDSRVLRFDDAAGTVMLSLNSAPDLGSYVFMSDRPTPDGRGTNEIHLEATWRSSLELRRRDGCVAVIADGDGDASHLARRDLADGGDERDPGCRLIQE